MAFATITARSGADWLSPEITWNRADGATLTGRTLRMQVRPQGGSPSLMADLDNASKGGITIIDAAARKFRITIPKASLIGMVGVTEFDLVCVEPGGQVLPIMHGTIKTERGTIP